MKKSIVAALAAVFMLAGLAGLAGCNTIRGVGQDVQKAGEAIEGAAKK